MSVTAVCPGSFDPIHSGHLDVIERAAARFDRLLVAVLVNESKAGLFTTDERLDLIGQSTAHLPNVEAHTFEGLLVDFCVEHDVDLVCKGVRAVSDFEYELQMAQMNRRLRDVETVFLPSSPAWSYLSSSLVREVARLGGRIEGTVPPPVEVALKARYAATGE